MNQVDVTAFEEIEIESELVLIDVYRYLIDKNNRSGYVVDLGENTIKLSSENNHKTAEVSMSFSMFDDLCKLGYVQCGIDGEYKDRYEVTTFGLIQCADYIDLYELKKEVFEYSLRVKHSK